MTPEERIAQLEAENAALKAKAAKGNDIRIKVSDKGAISVYGMGRFPVTLYKSQMVRFLAHSQQIIQFMKDHDGELSEKTDKAA